MENLRCDSPNSFDKLMKLLDDLDVEVPSKKALVEDVEERKRQEMNTEVLNKLRAELSSGYPCEKYQKLEKIGCGGTAQVYRGLEIKTGAEVAIKIMNTDPEPGCTIKPRLCKELVSLKANTHSNVTKYLDSYLMDEELWLVLEYVNGVTLADTVTKSSLTQTQVAIVCRDVLQGLHNIHNNGFVHRDVKSDNILLGKDGSVKITDFGYCVEEGPAMGAMIGTPWWMAPEQITCERYDSKVDIWGLGITIIEMLTQSAPYMDKDVYQTMDLIVNNGKPHLPSGLSPEMYNFIDRCLERDPEDRASASELLHHKMLTESDSSTVADLVQKVLEYKQKKAEAAQNVIKHD